MNKKHKPEHVLLINYLIRKGVSFITQIETLNLFHRIKKYKNTKMFIFENGDVNKKVYFLVKKNNNIYKLKIKKKEKTIYKKYISVNLLLRYIFRNYGIPFLDK